MKTHVETAISAKWVLTMDRDDSLQDHTVIIDHGRVLDILPSAEASGQYQPQEQVSLSQHILMPGLINAHTHAAMSLLRGYANDLPLEAWLQTRIWPAETQWATEEFVADGARLAIAEMIRGGCTCFNDMYLFPEVVAQVVKESGIRAMIGLIALEFPTPWANSADEYLQKGIALHDQLRDEPLISTAFAPHAPYTVSAKTMQSIALYSHEIDNPIHMHVHETEQEVQDFVQAHGVRPLQWLDEMNLLSPQFIAVHMTTLLDSEIARLAETGTHIVHCPESNLQFGHGFCPVAKLLKQGCSVSLGTDGAASNNDLDLWGEMRTAALLAKGTSGDPSAMTARDALHSVTLEAARTLQLEDQIGSISVGKWADLIAIDCHHPALQPIYDPMTQLAYSSGRDQVSDVWVAGRALMRARELLHMDVDALIARAAEWAQKIAAHGHSD